MASAGSWTFLWPLQHTLLPSEAHFKTHGLLQSPDRAKPEHNAPQPQLRRTNTNIQLQTLCFLCTYVTVMRERVCQHDLLIPTGLLEISLRGIRVFITDSRCKKGVKPVEVGGVLFLKATDFFELQILHIIGCVSLMLLLYGPEKCIKSASPHHTFYSMLPKAVPDNCLKCPSVKY